MDGIEILGIDGKEKGFFSLGNIIGSDETHRNRNEQLYIPTYQRMYEWEYEQVTTLLSDIKNKFKDERKNHFMGILYFQERKIMDFEKTSIITKHAEGKIDKLTSLADGQQRFTTLTILCGAIHNFSKKFKVNENVINATESIIYNDKNKKTFSLLIGDLDGTLMKHMETIIGSDNTLIEQSSNEIENTKNRLTNCYDTIKEWLEMNIKTIDELKSFVDFIINNLKFICIQVSINDENEIRELFSSINSKGKQLQSITAVKNEIYRFYYNMKVKETGWESSFNLTWSHLFKGFTNKQIEKMIGYEVMLDKDKKGSSHKYESYFNKGIVKEGKLINFINHIDEKEIEYTQSNFTSAIDKLASDKSRSIWDTIFNVKGEKIKGYIDSLDFSDFVNSTIPLNKFKTEIRIFMALSSSDEIWILIRKAVIQKLDKMRFDTVETATEWLKDINTMLRVLYILPNCSKFFNWKDKNNHRDYDPKTNEVVKVWKYTKTISEISKILKKSTFTNLLWKKEISKKDLVTFIENKDSIIKGENLDRAISTLPTTPLYGTLDVYKFTALIMFEHNDKLNNVFKGDVYQLDHLVDQDNVDDEYISDELIHRANNLHPLTDTYNKQSDKKIENVIREYDAGVHIQNLFTQGIWLSANKIKKGKKLIKSDFAELSIALSGQIKKTLSI